jgi:hypothetical protein
VIIAGWRPAMSTTLDRPRGGATDSQWMSEQHYWHSAYRMSRDQFLYGGRCWIRTNLAGFWLGAIVRKPPLTR